MSSRSVSRRLALRLGLAASANAAAASVLGCSCPCEAPARYAYLNAIQTHGVDPDEIAEPGTLVELSNIVRTASASGRRVRMTGSGHSFSDVAFTEDLLLRPQRLSRPLPIDWDEIKTEHRDPRRYVRVESGIKLRQLNPLLSLQGLGLENMGGYDEQTIVGAAMTGTHGSGLGFGPMASQIVSMQVVTTDGEVIQVEPTHGITEPTLFSSSIRTRDNDVVPARLEQDDALFNAMVVSMGTMGIVYSVTVRVVPKFWLAEKREIVTWGELTRPGGFFDNVMHDRRPLFSTDPVNPEYYEIYVNPYPSRPNDPIAKRTCLLTRRQRLTEAPAQLTAANRSRGQFGTDFVSGLALAFGRGTGVARVMNDHKEAVPGYIDSGLAALRDDTFIDLAPNVFHLGQLNEMRAYAVEPCFDLSQAVAATEHLFAMAEIFRDDGLIHPSPPSLRFVAPSAAPMAMQHGRRTFTIEIGMLACIDDGDELLLGYERDFIDRFRARPHWGLDLEILQSFAEVESLYPAARQWRALYERMNAKGTFDGKLTDRLGISMRPIS